ncbi:MAG: type II toxin-antitoxin system RelE/ParE family toxin [Novosphingobium sp.]
MSNRIDEFSDVLYTGRQYTIEQTALFADWLDRLSDRSGRIRILKRLSRLAAGNFGDVKSVGDGVSEMRMFFGPGYRAYYMLKDEIVLLLLAGGDKDSQVRDIARAKDLARKVRDGNQDNTL